MKTNLLLLQFIIAGLFSVKAQAQSFQKIFGHDVNTQTLSDIVPGSGNTLYGVGNFVNFDLQPQFNIYGTVTKLNTSGTVSWYKGYLPEDAISLEDFFMDSVLYANDAIYCFGHFVSMNVSSGYSLLKLTTAGEIIWSKHYFQNISGPTTCKAILHDGSIYAILHDRIIKINLDGQITNSIKINLESYTLNDITVSSSGQVLVMGNMVQMDLSKIILLKFDSNLQSSNGFTYSHENFHGTAIRSTTTGNKVIIGTENSLFCLNEAGEIQWFKTIPNALIGINNDFVQKVVDIKPINSTGGYLVLFQKLLTAGTTTNQEYIMLAKLNDTDGSLSDFKTIIEHPFAGLENFNGNTLKTDIQNGTYYIAGNLTFPSTATLQEFNYLHQGNYNQTNCGVESSTVTVENNTGIEVTPFPSGLSANTDIQFVDRAFFTINVSNDFQEKYCSTLSTKSFSKTAGIHPNPANDYLNIENIDQAAGILLTDITGKIIIDKKISENSTLDLSGLVKGIYILTISFENGDFQTEKIIKL